MKKTNLFEKFNKVFYALLILTAVSFTFTACDDTTEDPEPEAENSILEIVAASDNHTQLEAFVNANPDLVSVLEGNGVTLFAPNDAAFETLRTTLTVESLDQVNPGVIAAVLAFHVHTGGVVRSEDITPETTLSTVQKEEISFNDEGNIFNGCSNRNVQFVGEEILATNGVVHVVDRILIPETICATIGENLGKVSQTILLGADFSTLAAAIDKADDYAEGASLPSLADVLSGDDAITVFAPINDVFAGAGISLDSFTGEEWYGIIATHVVLGDYSAEAIGAALAQGNNTYATAAQTNIQITPTVFMENETIAAGGAPVVAADIESDNGRVHAVAGVVSSVNKYTTVLLGGQGSTEKGFYNAFSNVRYSYAEARDASTVESSPVDIAYYFGATNEATLASIDSDGLNNVYSSVDLPIEGIFGTRNSTGLRVTSLSPEQFDGILLNSQLEAAAASENNTNASATNLSEGSVVAFTLDQARGGYSGLVKVVSVDGNGNGTITLEVKVQVEGN
jgi:uncharacterized surface protein with fasciclin (FAS1) repeats